MSGRGHVNILPNQDKTRNRVAIDLPSGACEWTLSRRLKEDQTVEGVLVWVLHVACPGYKMPSERYNRTTRYSGSHKESWKMGAR